jgi:aspartate aminotransferase
MAVMRGEGAIEMVGRALELVRQGRDVVRMEVGDPDFETPPHITAAAVDALHDGKTHYEGAGGSPGLKEAAADFLRRTRPGLEVDPANIVCTPGGKPIIFHTIAALCEPGDEVIYPDPGFPAYETLFYN